MNLAAPEMLLGGLLAAPAGVPLAAVSGAVRGTLARRGHRLVEAAGCLHLECAPQHFDPRRFAAAQRGRFGARLEVWEELASTSERAWEAARQGAPAGTVVVAEVQTQGRGRQGRRWDCPAHAGLLFSLVVPALATHDRPQLLPLALAIGVAEALRGATGMDVRLKWPNDLVVPEAAGGSPVRKLGGLLLEAHPGPPACIVTGCGINVHVAPEFFAAHDLQGAVSLALPAALTRETLLAGILGAMERRYVTWETARWAALHEAWQSLDVLRGRSVVVQRGDDCCRGTARGITPLGLLQVQSSAGRVHTFAAGEVHLQ